MKPWFADTFFFLALLTRDSKAHQKAIELNRIEHPIVTSWFILLELADHLCDARNRKLFAKVREAVLTDRRFRFVDVSGDLLDQGVQLYEARPDKEWSLTDCTSFIIMRSEGMEEALTGDQHFEQAGFVALLNL